MANKTPLATWLYSQRQELNARFKEFSWPKHWLPEVFDFSTTIVWNGIEADGRGIDEHREIALEKAVAEAIERLICKSLGIDSVGLAVAGTHDPSTHARNEALERYNLDQHVLHQMPLQLVEEKLLMAKAFEARNPGSKIDFYRMATPENLFGVVCLMRSEDGQRRSLGFALADTLQSSLRRSLLEALPSYAWLMSQERELETEKSVLPWHIEEGFLKKMEPLLRVATHTSAAVAFIQPEVKKVDVALSQIPALKDAPIQVARFVLLGSEGLK